MRIPLLISFFSDMFASTLQLKNRNGSSRQALKKYVKANNNLNVVSDTMFDSLFNKALKAGVEKGVFEQPKGPSGGTKLAKAAKPAAAPKKADAEKKPAPKKEAEKKEPKEKKAAAPKKAPAKKAAPKKDAPKKAAAPKTEKKAAAPKKAAAKKADVCRTPTHRPASPCH
jgi:histone H1/5